jgi:predicted small secreted protein
MNHSRTVLLSLLGVIGTAAFVGGCETVEGVGRDVENLGDAIEDEARDERRDRD